MKNAAKKYFATSFMLVIALLLCHSSYAQEFPLKRWLGTWDWETYKTSPDSLMNTSDAQTKIANSYTLTADKSGINIMGLLVREEKDSLLGMSTVYHDYENNISYGVGPFGKSVFSYPTADSVVLKVYSFQDELINIQRIKFESDNLMDVTMESIVGPPMKFWVKGRRRP